MALITRTHTKRLDNNWRKRLEDQVPCWVRETVGFWRGHRKIKIGHPRKKPAWISIEDWDAGVWARAEGPTEEEAILHCLVRLQDALEKHEARQSKRQETAAPG